MKKLIIILLMLTATGLMAQRSLSGDTLKVTGGGSFGADIKLINSVKVDSILTTVIDSDGALITSGAVYDLLSSGIDSVDATNQSAVKFIRPDGTWIYESFSHVHLEYALMTQMLRVQDSITQLRTDINALSSGLWEIDGTETQLITADEIDMQTKKIINLVDPTLDQDAVTKIYVDGRVRIIEVNLDATDVNGLGTKFELIPAPGAGKIIQIMSIDYRIIVGLQLEVGAQTLELGFLNGSTSYTNVLNGQIEVASGTEVWQLSHKENADNTANDSFACVLSATTNPSGGSVTMDFYITYRIITL